MSSIQQSATVLWRVVSGLSKASSDMADVLALLPGKRPNKHKHNPEVLERMLNVYSNQPTTPELVAKWREHFIDGQEVSVKQSKEFVNDVLGSLEDIDELLPLDAYAGETIMRKNSLGDYTVKRVLRRKKGWSLHLTVEGKGVYNCIRQQLVAEPGDLVLISPEGIYDYHREERSSCWMHRWVYFNHAEEWSRWLQWPELGPGIFHLKASGDSYKKLQSLFAESIADPMESGAYSLDLLKNLTEQILIRCQSLRPPEKSQELSEKILRVTDYISDHYAEDFDLQVLADEVCLSRPRLSALFKEQVGTSIMRWRDEKRLS